MLQKITFYKTISCGQDCLEGSLSTTRDGVPYICLCFIMTDKRCAVSRPECGWRHAIDVSGIVVDSTTYLGIYSP